MYIIWLKIQRYEKISEETKERNKILIKEAWLFPERIDEEDRFRTALRESWLTITGKSWCGLYQQGKDRIEHPVAYLSGYHTWESGKAWKQRDTVVGSVFLLSPLSQREMAQAVLRMPPEIWFPSLFRDCWTGCRSQRNTWPLLPPSKNFIAVSTLYAWPPAVGWQSGCHPTHLNSRLEKSVIVVESMIWSHFINWMSCGSSCPRKGHDDM